MVNLVTLLIQKGLYIGNASDKGGVVVGNKWQGSNADLDSLAPAVTGDYAYETDTREFKVLNSRHRQCCC